MKQKNDQGDYDTLYPKTLGSQVEGMTLDQVSGNLNSSRIEGNIPSSQIEGIFSAEQILTQSTAALFGLDTNAVPDDVLAYLGKYNQYWWRRRTFEATKIDFGPVEQIQVLWRSSSSRTWDVPYSEEVSIVGAVAKLKDKKTLSVSYSTYTEANKLKGKYFYEYDTENVCYVEPSAPDATRSGAYYVYISAKKVQKVTPGYPTGDWEYIQSSDRSAYPDSGEQDGYEYQYLGIPFDNAATAPKIATGSYVGTETYGESYPNSLTFEFEPKLLIVQRNTDLYPGGFIWIDGISKIGSIFTDSSSGASLHISIIKNEKYITWYSTSGPENQMNSVDSYCYIAIG